MLKSRSPPRPHPASPGRSAQRRPATSPKPFPGWSVRRGLMVASTLGLIAGLGAPAIGEETGRGQRSQASPALMEGSASWDGSPSSYASDASQERVRTLAYHLGLGRDLIFVTTDNSYEIETIFEIFKAGGALHYSHLVDSGEPEVRNLGRAAAAAVHSHATILNDRVRESA